MPSVANRRNASPRRPPPSNDELHAREAAARQASRKLDLNGSTVGAEQPNRKSLLGSPTEAVTMEACVWRCYLESYLANNRRRAFPDRRQLSHCKI